MATALSLDIDTAEWALPLLGAARYKGAVGGRARGASHFFAGLAVEEMVCDPDLHFVCIREVQRALRYSAKALVESKIRSHGVADLFEILNTEIRRKGGTGVMIFEGMQDHTADSIKSLEGFGRAWVEEAHSLSERSLRLLRPTIRAPGSEIWFSWNRESPDDAVDAFFTARAGDPNVRVVEATYRDNPFIEREMLQEAEDDRRTDPEMYEHVWGGGYFLGGSGRVYSSFLGKPWPEGNLDESIEDTGGDLLVGIDFNVDPMSAVIAVRAVDECLVLDALRIMSSNTEELADEVKGRYPNRRYIAMPDPAGKQRHTNAPVGQTDFTILQRAGFEVRAPSAAPPVKDRINNTNSMFLDKKTDRRRCRVHPRAKYLTTGLANLVYKEGTSHPEKGAYGHVCAALGYLLWQEFNVLTAPRHAALVESPFG
jgi:hypothetical protein